MESNVVELQQEEESFPLCPYEDICVISQESEEKSRGGILLVGKSKDFQSGRVVAAGPGRVYSNYLDASGEHKIGHFVPNPVKVGDYVIFGRYLSGGEAIMVNEKRYLLARAGDLGGKSANGKPMKIRLADPIE